MANRQDDTQSWSDFVELRKLLFEREFQELETLRTQQGTPEISPETLSDALPPAIVRGARKDNKLAQSLTPIVEEALDGSIKRHPQKIVEAIFPVIGPAIRRSIKENLTEMVQSFNTALAQGFSLKGLKWRYEALKTGRPFAEVALSHSLVYRVEQVFLIHRESGLLLAHAAQESVDTHDGDMISSMLTAIQDFVQDSFGDPQDGGLETLQVGELSVWIEQGPLAILAGVVKGEAPEDLRRLFRSTLENIHLEFHDDLVEYAGDSEPFVRTLPLLENCLRVQREQKTSGAFASFGRFVIFVLAVLAIVLTPFIRSDMRWDAFVQDLNTRPGIVITENGTRDGVPYVAGLRDPLAINPDTIQTRRQLDIPEVRYLWKPYQSLETEFVMARAQRMLNPPESVAFSLEDGALVARGSASNAWISRARIVVTALPGVYGYRDDQVVNDDLATLVDDIEEQAFFFDLGRSSIRPAHVGELRRLANRVNEVRQGAVSESRQLIVEVIGQADELGSEAYNLHLSQQRADSVLTYLVRFGMNVDSVHALGIGSRKRLATETWSWADLARDRRAWLNIKVVSTSQEPGSFHTPNAREEQN